MMKLIPIFTYPKMAAPHGSPSYREAAHIIRDKQTIQSFNTYGATPQEQWNTAGVLTTNPGYHFPPKDNKQTRQARSHLQHQVPKAWMCFPGNRQRNPAGPTNQQFPTGTGLLVTPEAWDAGIPSERPGLVQRLGSFGGA